MVSIKSMLLEMLFFLSSITNVKVMLTSNQRQLLSILAFWVLKKL